MRNYTTERTPLIAQFATEEAAQAALDQLNQSGFRKGWLRVATPDAARELRQARHNGVPAPGTAVIAVDTHGHRTTVAHMIERRGGIVFS